MARPKKRPGDQVLVATGTGELSAEEQQARAAKADFMGRARKQYQTGMAATAQLREKQLDDLKFVASEQWDPKDVADRKIDQRPCLTINRIPQFINQVVNAARQSRPAVQVSPIGNGDEKVAEVFQGIIRHIEQQSDAQVAYVTASEAQARIGLGFWQITTDFIDDSFSQAISIKRIRNPFSVVDDPTTQEVDRSDRRFCFIIEDLPTDTYVEKYGSASKASLDEFMLGGERTPDWMPEGKVRIAAWWYIDTTPDELRLIEWTANKQQDITSKRIMDTWPPERRALCTILRHRPTEQRDVRCAVINACEILEGNADKTKGALWPGKWIPIVPVIGQEIDINGQLDYRGMVRDAKDPQRLYNYQNTALAESLALAPKAPYIGFTGSFEGHEDKWRAANRRNFPYLEANAYDVNDKPIGLPQRQTADTPVAAITRAIMQADNDLKATMGLFDPSLGARGPAQSGKAIGMLQKQGEMANSNFLDNLARSIRFTGRILIDLIPKIYDVPTVVRILGKDERPKTVMVHAGAGKDALPPEGHLPEGVTAIYDLSIGTYDVSISVGPSQESRRQEAVQNLTAIIQAVPATWPILGDLVVENMDWPGAIVAAERLKKGLPPQFQDQAAGQPEIPPQVAQQMQQGQQQIQLLQQQLQELHAALTSAQQTLSAKQLELDATTAMKREQIAADERIARLKLGVEWMIAQAKMGQTADIQKFEAEVSRVEMGLDHAQAGERSAQDHAEAIAEQAHGAAHQAALTPPPAPQTPPGLGNQPIPGQMPLPAPGNSGTLPAQQGPQQPQEP